MGRPAAAAGGAVGLVLGERVIGLFQGGLLGRACSWAVLGLGIGLGQGLADRSRQRLVFGLIGGGLGGFVGGYCFEALRVALGNRYDLSQALGIVILGGGLGLGLALVEQALRRAWVQVQSGRQEGRVYLLAHACRLGLDERAEVGIFGDPRVASNHAEIEASARGIVFRHLAPQATSRINGKPVSGGRAAPRRRPDRAGPDPAGVPTEVRCGDSGNRSVKNSGSSRSSAAGRSGRRYLVAPGESQLGNALAGAGLRPGRPGRAELAPADGRPGRPASRPRPTASRSATWTAPAARSSTASGCSPARCGRSSPATWSSSAGSSSR